MKDTFILFLFAALAFSGCRKQVSNYDRPDFDPQPTLNAVLQEKLLHGILTKVNIKIM